MSLRLWNDALGTLGNKSYVIRAIIAPNYDTSFV